MSDVTERWRSERVMAPLYDVGVKHDGVAMVGAWAMGGADMRRMFADVARLKDPPPGTSVLDVPCGGFAFRGLPPGQPVRYIAADISSYMLEGAHREVHRLEVRDAVEFVKADVTSLRFDDESFDLCVTYNGRHCLPDPHAALKELTRVLRRGGTLRGTSCVTGRGPRRRPDRNVASHRRVRKCPAHRRYRVVALERSGAVEFFEAKLNTKGTHP
jgi:SAM-dependent methyltransferase